MERHTHREFFRRWVLGNVPSFRLGGCHDIVGDITGRREEWPYSSISIPFVLILRDQEAGAGAESSSVNSQTPVLRTARARLFLLLFHDPFSIIFTHAIGPR
jgi:hypothetical protein